jgi:hypothetical protein
MILWNINMWQLNSYTDIPTTTVTHAHTLSKTVTHAAKQLYLFPDNTFFKKYLLEPYKRRGEDKCNVNAKF